MKNVYIRKVNNYLKIMENYFKFKEFIESMSTEHLIINNIVISLIKKKFLV